MISSIKRIVLIDVVDPKLRKDIALRDLQELQSLVKTYGGVDIVRIVQHRTRPDKATFIGSGKIFELVQIVKKERINTIVINAIVNPSILFNITQYIWPSNPDIQVWDRIDLILNIFEKHAATSEAKLQIEIARMRHMGPRVFGLGGTYFSKQDGGIGTKGLGETNTELMKRHWRDQIKEKQDMLAKLSHQHELQLQRRKENGVKSISIVGYTNAGKTSLFNLLAKKQKVVENALFVTLDSVTGKLYFPKAHEETTISDTIGFIKELPSSLIQSFKSTLMESVHADLLIHVIDITDPEMNQKILTVEQILKELQIETKKIIYVFNKIDAFEGNAEEILVNIKKNYNQFSPQFISVKDGDGIDKLKKQIEKELFSI
ncbi:MAG: GTPase HflX [bacterium]|nr:GTPase HflX [bacterium]